jgi:hypothetical protein
MPKLCESCAHFSDDGETICPACGAALRSSEARPSGWGGGVGARLFGSPLGLVAVFVVILAVAWAVGDWMTAAANSGKGADTAGRIRAGMHISEVGRVLDDGPPPSPSYPRLRDQFPPDEFGDGTINYEGDGVKLTIEFVGGYVTAVEEAPSSLGPGPHSYKMIVRQR